MKRKEPLVGEQKRLNGFGPGALVFGLVLLALQRISAGRGLGAVLDWLSLNSPFAPLIAIALGALMIGVFLWERFYPDSVTNTFERSAARTEAKVTHKFEEIKQYLEDESIQYDITLEVTLEFELTGKDNQPTKYIVVADVDGEFFEELEIGQTIPIRYAEEKPQIFVIEGENLF